MNNHTSPTTEAVISVDRGNTDGDMTGVGVRCICGKLYTFTHDPAIRVEVTGVQCLCGYFATTHGSLRSAPEPAAPTTNSVSSSSKSASPGEPCGKRWYLASKNDGLFIIDTRPNTDNDSPHHETTRGPDMALNVTDLPQAKAQAIVDAHNARLSGEPSAEQAPIARINVENNGLIEVATVMHLYAPGLPPGEHDLYCEAGADPVRLAADELVAHIGAVGEIDSRHRLVLNCLEALNSTGLPRAPEPRELRKAVEEFIHVAQSTIGRMKIRANAGNAGECHGDIARLFVATEELMKAHGGYEIPPELSPTKSGDV